MLLKYSKTQSFLKVNVLQRISYFFNTSRSKFGNKVAYINTSNVAEARSMVTALLKYAKTQTCLKVNVLQRISYFSNISRSKFGNNVAEIFH